MMVRTFEAQNFGADTVDVLLLYSDNLRQSHHARDSILVKNSKIPKSIEKKQVVQDCTVEQNGSINKNINKFQSL